MKRTTEFTVRTDEVLIIKRSSAPVAGWCTECAAQARMVTPEEAAAIAYVSWRTIAAWVAEGRLHCTEEPEGFVLICLNSISAVD